MNNDNKGNNNSGYCGCLIFIIIMAFLLYSCSNNSSKSSSNNSYGYGNPKPGESLSDYMKREDPSLWNDMENRWDTLFGN